MHKHIVHIAVETHDDCTKKALVQAINDTLRSLDQFDGGKRKTVTIKRIKVRSIDKE